MKVWSGTAWAEKPAKVWNGSAWAAKPVKVWSGSAWVTKPPVVSGPVASILTSYTPGTDRNDFTGEVGVRLGIGGANITFSWLGVRSNGIGGTRTIKLYEWFSGVVVQTMAIDYGSAAAGVYVWTKVPAYTMLANGYYALLMVCTAGDGQTWKNPGPAVYTGMANIYDSYYAGGLQTGLQNSAFVGLDLGW